MTEHVSVASGSSPLTRGKPRSYPTVREGRRLIPAHAGKTIPRNCPAWPVPAHPRSRGENPAAKKQPTAAEGSSPLTRGKQVIHPRPVHPNGLIPAHAGKTTTTHHTRLLSRAHPRSRGENGGSAYAEAEPVGSSPLTRGKRPGDDTGGETRGLIPAHAGKTVTLKRRLSRARAHPRSRGENVGYNEAHDGGEGSSPLTRGKQR